MPKDILNIQEVKEAKTAANPEIMKSYCLFLHDPFYKTEKLLNGFESFLKKNQWAICLHLNPIKKNLVEFGKTP